MNRNKKVLIIISALIVFLLVYSLLIQDSDSAVSENSSFGFDKELTGYPPPAIHSRLKEFSFKNKDQQLFGYEQLYGKIWLSHFHFDKCDKTCPNNKKALKSLRKQLDKLPIRNNIDIVSFMSEKTSKLFNSDINENNKAKHHINWNVLTGNADDINYFRYNGFKLKVDHLEHMTHKNQDHRIALIDESMFIRGYYDLTDNNNLKYLIKDINHLFLEYQEKKASINIDSTQF